MKYISVLGGLAFISLFTFGVVGCSSHGVKPKEGTNSALSESVSSTDSERLKNDPNRVVVEYDEFTKATSYFGEGHVIGGFTGEGISGAVVYLSAFHDAKGSGYSLVVDSMYEAEQYISFNEAVDISGARYPVRKDRHKVECSSGGCLFYETVLVDISRKDIEDRKNTGFRIRLQGSSGRQEINLPAAYLKGFLTKVPAV